jgi:phytanoyl-CoA hydroxylase
MNLSERQLAEFRDNGYLIIKQLAPPALCDQMLAVTRKQLETPEQPVEYEADVGYAGAPTSRLALGGATIRRLRGAYERDASFRNWATDSAQVTKLEQLLGEQICLSLTHHNCVMTKHPNFGTATGWHRDIRYWSFTRPDLVCVWLALGHETAENGGLKFIPGSHRLDIQPRQLDALDFLRPEVEENFPLFDQGKQIELEKGDVVFFHSKLFHAAGRNSTDTIKTSVAFAYYGVSNPPISSSRSASAGDVKLTP